MHGALLINLGTPQAPTADQVGNYLREFLMDPFVIDIPFVLRWPLVNLVIVPRRAPVSASQYAKVWMRDGSPLMVHTEALTREVRARLPDMPVEMAMRYGQPSIPSALEKLKARGVTRVLALPLYPQYSLAATESCVERTRRASAALGLETVYFPAFFDRPEYLDAVASVSRPHVEREPFDMALFSFHGLPERQVAKAPQNYRDQCFVTAREVARRLGIAEERYRVCFQSRLGRTPWIRPYTDEFYRTLPGQGVKRIVVLCPSFVADCLETLEEVSIRGEEEFRRNGGESLRLVPSLNSSAEWADAVAAFLACPSFFGPASS